MKNYLLKIVLITIISAVPVYAAETNWRAETAKAIETTERCKQQLNKEIQKRMEVEKKLAVAKNEQGYIIKVPFTDIGLTAEETKGFIFGYLAAAVHPIFAVGLLL